MSIFRQTHYMQGNCGGLFHAAPGIEGAPLRPLLPHQCVLLADENLITVDESSLWLDNVYIRLTAPRNISFNHFIDVRGSSSKLWMSSVTVQGRGAIDGDKDCNACGLAVSSSASVSAEGVHFELLVNN